MLAVVLLHYIPVMPDELPVMARMTSDNTIDTYSITIGCVTSPTPRSKKKFILLHIDSDVSKPHNYIFLKKVFFFADLSV